jgi:hypothetical protein
VPIVELPPATTKARQIFAGIIGIREVPGGKVLVNDARNRRMVRLDSTLAQVDAPLDSIPGNSGYYGPRIIPILPYLGDSTLTTDPNAGTLLMLGPTGKVERALASPYTQTVPPFVGVVTALRDRYSGVDEKGRILFEGRGLPLGPDVPVAERVAQLARDTVPILRADLVTRRLDTVAFVKSGGSTRMMGRADPSGPVRVSRMPAEAVDVWGVTTSGAVGVVRGHDYHVDWIEPDGRKHSSAKLPFDWKRLGDEEKQKLIDSTRVEVVRTMGLALTVKPMAEDDGKGAGGRAQAPPGVRAPGAPTPVEYVPPELKDIPDFYPALRISAAIADMDGNLWILPNTSAQSKNGELVYDVVNPAGDFHRVRLPLGRSIAGFGKGGVVFLQVGDRVNGWTLERTRVPSGTAKTK